MEKFKKKELPLVFMSGKSEKRGLFIVKRAFLSHITKMLKKQRPQEIPGDGQRWVISDILIKKAIFI